MFLILSETKFSFNQYIVYAYIIFTVLELLYLRGWWEIRSASLKGVMILGVSNRIMIGLRITSVEKAKAVFSQVYYE